MSKQKILLIVGVVLLIVIVVVLLFISLSSLNQNRRSGSSGDVTPTEAPFDRTPALDEEAMRQTAESLRLTAPDVYLKNQVPVVQSTFIFDAYIDREREQYVFTVSPKISSLQEVQQDVQDWLISIGLTDDQINSLIIEYIQ